jgi:hypothetical protein
VGSPYWIWPGGKFSGVISLGPHQPGKGAAEVFAGFQPVEKKIESIARAPAQFCPGSFISKL